MNDQTPNPTFAAALERAALRLRDRATWLLLRGGVAVGAAGALLAPTPGCADLSEFELEPQESTLLSSDVRSWAQTRGTRSRDMVRFEGHSWREVSDCGFRGGCSTVTVFVQLFVRNVPGVNLDDKSVGLVVRQAGRSDPFNALGSYIRNAEDGWEEWHVPVRMRSWEGTAFSFDAWYEDGVWENVGGWRKRVWVDDNVGELYPVTQYAGAAVQQLYRPDGILVDGGLVTGVIDLRVANFDFDKELELVWTTDDWATTHVFGMGGGETNAWHYVEPICCGEPSDYERWRIELDIAGASDHFEYAIVYRHGLGDGARPYEFWDNAGYRNYRVEAPQ